MAKLLLIEDGTVQEIQMGQEITIGRAYSNLLRLEGEEMSRVHAIIYRRGADYILRDLDSKNGVYLNGQKIVNSLIDSGDQIQVGKYVLIFDPPEDFDMTGFLRRHNLADGETHSRKQKATEDAKTQADEEEASEDTDYSQQSLVFSKNNGAPTISDPPIDSSIGIPGKKQVFYRLEDIDRMSETQSAPPYSPEFLNDLLRMLRQLTARYHFEEHEEDDSAVYHAFLSAAMAGVGAERGVVVLKDEVDEALRLGAIFPPDKDVAVNRVVLRSALRKQNAVLCNDVAGDDRFHRTETVAKERIGSLIAMPLMRGDAALGLIYLDVLEQANSFRQEHLLMLHFLSRLLAMALRPSKASN